MGSLICSSLNYELPAGSALHARPGRGWQARARGSQSKDGALDTHGSGADVSVQSAELQINARFPSSRCNLLALPLSASDWLICLARSITMTSGWPSWRPSFKRAAGRAVGARRKQTSPVSEPAAFQLGRYRVGWCAIFQAAGSIRPSRIISAGSGWAQARRDRKSAPVAQLAYVRAHLHRLAIVLRRASKPQANRRAPKRKPT